MSSISTKLLQTSRMFSARMCRDLIYRNGINRNYWRRRDAFSDLSSAMQSFDNYVKEVDREMNRVFGDFRRMNPLNLPRMLSPTDWGRVRDIPVISTDGSDRLYKMELEMEGMKPENINIILKNNELTVTARRDEKRSDGSRFVRENTYHYTLPSEINLDTVRSSLSDGILTIEAQLPAVEEAKEIPINIESGEKPPGSDSNSSKK